MTNRKGTILDEETSEALAANPYAILTQLISTVQERYGKTDTIEIRVYTDLINTLSQKIAQCSENIMNKNP